MIEDFIGIFDNALTPKECKNFIDYITRLKTLNLVFDRQTLGDGAPHDRNDDSAFILEPDCVELTFGNPAMDPMIKTFWNCYREYLDHYSILTDGADKHGMWSIRLQHTKPGGGYHRWHYEQGASEVSRRFLAWMIYLNDVEEGGETEFLYQKRRVQAKQGRLVMWPAGFTHTHRGNPPLSGDKYALTGWLEFMGNSK